MSRPDDQPEKGVHAAEELGKGFDGVNTRAGFTEAAGTLAIQNCTGLVAHRSGAKEFRESTSPHEVPGVSYCKSEDKANIISVEKPACNTRSVMQVAVKTMTSLPQKDQATPR